MVPPVWYVSLVDDAHVVHNYAYKFDHITDCYAFLNTQQCTAVAMQELRHINYTALMIMVPSCARIIIYTFIANYIFNKHSYIGLFTGSTQYVDCLLMI